jgi:DivIVA domain-containing protein
MPLTPEDVVNKRFQPTKFREGYDQDEVDDFLDEIVVELRRLTQENEDLRQRLLASESRIAELQRSGAGLVAEINSPTAESALAPAIAPSAVSAFPEATQDPSTLDTNNTNNLLQLARKLHEEHVREGLAKRDALIAEGHATATKIVADAEATANAQITKYEIQIAELEVKTSELKEFEAEYRLRLRTYIEGQLRDLEATSTPSAS